MVVKKILKNGLAILVSPQWHIPKVSLQLWYNVGSKDEITGQRGIAHLIEHMIFKGTEKLSGSDINLIMHKLSGSCNAFTSHDYTGYLFDLPLQHWHYSLEIMADCMINCAFKEELLGAELKAVIQELKMYNDDYTTSLIERMMAAIFYDHPYHYPVIGYKQDLWSLNYASLKEFYRQHYIPNNATLVVVGSVDPEDVFERTEKAFGAIPPVPKYRKVDYYHALDIVSQSITIYRDVQQPTVLLVWTIPGACERKDYILDIVSWLLGGGKGSRLTQLLIDKYALVTDLETFVYDLFEQGLFIIKLQPKQYEDIEKIIDIIKQELESIVSGGITQSELQRAVKKTEMDFISLAEDNQKHAYLLGKYYLATGDEHYLENYTKFPHNELADAAIGIIRDYLRPAVMHRGMVLPIVPSERSQWRVLQERSDAEDARVLGGVGEACLEPGSVVHTIPVIPIKHFNFPKVQRVVLANGLKVLCCHNPTFKKIEIIMDFKARHYYDMYEKQGCMLFMMDMLQEGTTRYSSVEFAQEIESYGMSLSTFPGVISLSILSGDLRKGLSLLYEMLTQAAFRQDSIEKILTQILSDIVDFWDAPTQFVTQVVRDVLYKNHPYQCNILGSRDSIISLTRNDIVNAYQAYITPQETCFTIVGDLQDYSVFELIDNIFGSWKGPHVSDLSFPVLSAPVDREIAYPINRDQMVFALAGLSVRRFDPDYDKLLLFDQILTGGVLNSMNSRLFELREKTGLFYTIGGSVTMGANEEPGMAFIKTIVSPDKLNEAQKLITEILDRGADDVSETELEEAKLALINSLVDNFATNRQMAQAFVFMNRFKLPDDFFDMRAQQLQAIKLQEVKHVVKQHLNTKRMIKIKIGRL